MFLRLLLLLTFVPIVELFVLLKVHAMIAERTDFMTGLAVTVGTILVTGVLGAYLARSQGIGVVRDLQRALTEGRFPARQLVDGALVLVGGAFLLTPGFITDLVGLSLLVPVSRAAYRQGLEHWLKRRLDRGDAFVQFRAGPEARQNPWDAEATGERVIDVTPDDQGRS